MSQRFMTPTHEAATAAKPSPTPDFPVALDDPVNRRILAVSEDQVAGFHRCPFTHIAERSGVELGMVVDRIAAMLKAGLIRRVRQTLLATNLAHGALVAWRVPEASLTDSFDWMHRNDPFTGHVVIRSTDPGSAGAGYRLWTTVKVPQGYELAEHCDLLQRLIGAESYHAMPARRLFRLGVGHVRRRALAPGAMAEDPAVATEPSLVKLTDEQWRVLRAIKRELEPDEIQPDPWRARAQALEMSIESFCGVAEGLNKLGVIGRFSTFLEHVKPVASQGGKSVTRYNGLFHWSVPTGREIEAGSQVGRFHVLTHAYWREAGPQFGNVNIMAVAHGLDRDLLLEHKAAIDQHLSESGIDVGYTNVFWGGRSEIKPSEICPEAYAEWRAGVG